jgi:hypothetical protein
MRFMMIVKSDGQSEAGAQPSTELIDAMSKYNEQLADAGVLLAAEGLTSSSEGARVHYDAATGDRTVVDGPFAEAKELVAGFWLIEVRSKEEAVEWARRCPFEAASRADGTAEIEVRHVAALSDLVEMTEEQREAERKLRERIPGI